ncbi:MAG: sulfotransferase domain-containing protein [Actinobacteria bacterium]|nr:sulfotransferase domain-containing protein [Actinomycetota bacterium]
MLPPPHRYQSPDEDSARWVGFEFREGDTVISTRSKHGTTWVQMICALLVFQTEDLPAPLGELSPWLDWLVEPRDDVFRRLEAQRHRRIIKTHTPLDGIPVDPKATYIVAARHPVDAAVSLYHQGDNLNRARIAALTGLSQPTSPPERRPPLHDWLMRWITGDAGPQDDLDSLAGVMWHLSGAWERRVEHNVVLVHYDDLSADLEGEMRRLAKRLGLSVTDGTWPELVHAAKFDHMRTRADRLAPDNLGVLRDRARFFRRGSSGAGREVLSDDELALYHARTAGLAPPDLLAWLHRDGWPVAGLQ